MRNFELVKSLTRVINNYKGLLILCLSLAVFGVESAWGTKTDYYSKATVSANPSGGGKVYVAYDSSTKPASPNSEAKKEKDSQESAPDHTYHFWADVNPGYSWSGWTFTKGNPNSSSTQSNATSTITAAENVNNATITATANFTAHKYKVNFYGNGATGGSMNQQELTYGQTSLNANAFSRSYTVNFDADGGSTADSKTATYTFNNWNTKADGSGESYNDKQTNLTTENNVTINLYAQWGSASITLPSSTKSGYVLDGWYSGDIKIGAPGDSYTPTANITLKAKWQGKYTPEISYTGSTSYNVGDGPIDLSQLWKSTGNGAITYSKVSFTPASGQQGGSTEPAITSNRYLSLNKAGTLKIHLAQAETSTYYGGSADVTITISRITNTLTVDGSHTMYVDDQWTSVISSKNSDGTITTSSTDATIASYDVANNKIVAPNSSAKSFNSTEVTITISQAETYKYTSASKTIKVTVNKYDNHISINGNQDNYQTSIYMDSYAQIDLTATNTDYAGSPITNNQTKGADIATFYQNDRVVYSTYKLGDATWSLSQPENYKYKAANATMTVNVVKQEEATDCYVLNDGKEYSLNTIETGDAIVINGPADKLYFDIKYQGTLFTALYLHVEYSTNNGSSWTEVIEIKERPNDYKTYGPYQLPENANRVRFKTTTGSTNKVYYKNIKVTRKTYLNVANVSITKTSSGSDIYSTTTGDNYTGAGNLVINHSLANGGDLKVTWDNPKFTINGQTSAEIINLGDKGCSTGTTTLPITFESAEVGTFTTTVTIYNAVYSTTATITGTTVKRPQTISWNAATAFNSTDKPTLNATVSSGLSISSYTSNQDWTKVVNGNQLEFYNSGTVSITVKQNGNAYYNAKEITQQITINKVTPVITVNPTPTATITYGQKLNTVGLSGGAAKVNSFRGQATDHAVTGLFAWTNGDYTVVETGGTTHEYDVTFTPTGAEAGMYNNASCKVTVIVNKITPTLTAKNEEDLEVYVNDTQTPKLNLVDYITEYSAADDTHGHVQAKSAITFACNQDGAVIEGNKFYATKAGTYTITATAPPTDYYNSQTTTFTIKAYNYYYSRAYTEVVVNAQTGNDGGWVSVWQNDKPIGDITTAQWLHSDQTSANKRIRTSQSVDYYYRAKIHEGYTFDGWFTTTDAVSPVSTALSFNEVVTNITSRDNNAPTWVNRYAKFTPITYTVTFVGNGNTGGSMSDQTFTYDVAKNLTANGFTRTGWSFTGWKDGNGTTYTDAQSVSNLASTQGAVITMTAQWNQDIYTVTLDPATYGTGGTAQISVKYNELIPTSIIPPTPIDPAYIFLGYYDGDMQYYKADGTAVSGKKWLFTEGKTLTAKWQSGDYIKSWDVADSYTAQSNIPYDIAKSFSGAPVTYSIEGTDEGVITINNTQKYIYANKKGTVIIKACPMPSEGYSSVTPDTHEITIVGKEQIIEWNQNFSFMAASDGSINTYSNSLQAVSKDTLGTPTGRTVTYKSSNENVAKVESDGQGGWRLHVIGYGTDGTCTITASAAGNDIYEPGSIGKTIRIVREGDKCGTTIYKQSEDSKYMNGIIFNAAEPKTISFGVVPCDSISFKIKHAWQIFSTKECIITMTDSKGNKYTVYEGTATQDQTPEEVNYRVPEEAAACQQIDFKTGANVNYTVTNLEVKQRSYLKPTVAAPMSYDPATNTYPIDLNVSIGDYANNVQFVINYSDEPCVLYSIEGDAENAFVLTPDREIDNTCGDVGSYTFTLKTTKTWWIEKTITATIKIYTSSGDQVIIPVSVHYTLGNQYQLAKDGDLSAELNWEDLNNWWLRDGTHPEELPTMKNPVMILNPVRINSHVEAYEITKGEYAPGKVRITIAPEGGLTVFTGGITGFDYDKEHNHSRIVIESSKDHQGYLRMTPDLNMPMMKMPIGTIQLATKSTLDNGANDDAVWQYIGVPVVEYDDFEGKDLEDMPFTVDYITWLYEWSEPKGWVDMKNVPQPVRLKPFTGYAITQYGQPIYEFTGRFLHDNVRIPLTCTDEPGMQGDNVIANSYTSPIDVTLVDQTDFEGGNVIQAFYVFNSGSYNQWKEKNNSGDGRGIQTGSLSNYTPGQYIAIPTKSGAEIGENELTMIAPMQGFDIYATEKGKTAYFNLNYRKHVWNATNARGQMNEPLRAPKTDDTYMPDDVARQYAIWDSINAAKQARIDAITHRVRLIAYGENSGNDRVVIIESPLYAKQYENGADAPKMFAETEGLLGLYTNEQDCGLMSVNATNSVDGMFVGFRAGSDSEYELSASNVIGQPLRLIDLQTQQMIDLKDSATYTFTAEPNSQDDFRFQIINQDIHINPTGWGGLGAKAKIWYYKQTLYVSDAAANSTAAIYTADGVTLKQVTFNHNTTISTQDIPEGVYTVRVEDSVLKVFVKH